MSLPDLVFATGAICFSVALVPMVRGPHKPALSSAALTSFWLWAFAITYGAMGLVFSAVSTGVSAALWTALGVQVWRG